MFLIPKWDYAAFLDPAQSLREFASTASPTGLRPVSRIRWSLFTFFHSFQMVHPGKFGALVPPMFRWVTSSSSSALVWTLQQPCALWIGPNIISNNLSLSHLYFVLFFFPVSSYMTVYTSIFKPGLFRLDKISTRYIRRSYHSPLFHLHYSASTYMVPSTF